MPLVAHRFWSDVVSRHSGRWIPTICWGLNLWCHTKVWITRTVIFPNKIPGVRNQKNLSAIIHCQMASILTNEWTSFFLPQLIRKSSTSGRRTLPFIPRLANQLNTIPNQNCPSTTNKKSGFWPQSLPIGEKTGFEFKTNHISPLRHRKRNWQIFDYKVSILNQIVLLWRVLLLGLKLLEIRFLRLNQEFILELRSAGRMPNSETGNNETGWYKLLSLLYDLLRLNLNSDANSNG